MDYKDINFFNQEHIYYVLVAAAEICVGVYIISLSDKS